MLRRNGQGLSRKGSSGQNGAQEEEKEELFDHKLQPEGCCPDTSVKKSTHSGTRNVFDISWTSDEDPVTDSDGTKEKQDDAITVKSQDDSDPGSSEAKNISSNVQEESPSQVNRDVPVEDHGEDEIIDLTDDVDESPPEVTKSLTPEEKEEQRLKEWEKEIENAKQRFQFDWKKVLAEDEQKTTSSTKKKKKYKGNWIPRPIVSPTITEEKNTQTLQKKNKEQVDDRIFKCKDCSSVFHNLEQFALHRNQFFYKCPLCQIIFDTNVHYKNHIPLNHKSQHKGGWDGFNDPKPEKVPSGRKPRCIMQSEKILDAAVHVPEDLSSANQEDAQNVTWGSVKVRHQTQGSQGKGSVKKGGKNKPDKIFANILREVMHERSRAETQNKTAHLKSDFSVEDRRGRDRLRSSFKGRHDNYNSSPDGFKKTSGVQRFIWDRRRAEEMSSVEYKVTNEDSFGPSNYSRDEDSQGEFPEDIPHVGFHRARDIRDDIFSHPQEEEKFNRKGAYKHRKHDRYSDEEFVLLPPRPKSMHGPSGNYIGKGLLPHPRDGQAGKGLLPHPKDEDYINKPYLHHNDRRSYSNTISMQRREDRKRLSEEEYDVPPQRMRSQYARPYSEYPKEDESPRYRKENTNEGLLPHQTKEGVDLPHSEDMPFYGHGMKARSSRGNFGKGLLSHPDKDDLLPYSDELQNQKSRGIKGLLPHPLDDVEHTVHSDEFRSSAFQHGLRRGESMGGPVREKGLLPYPDELPQSTPGSKRRADDYSSEGFLPHPEAESGLLPHLEDKSYPHFGSYKEEASLDQDEDGQVFSYQHKIPPRRRQGEYYDNDADEGLLPHSYERQYFKPGTKSNFRDDSNKSLLPHPDRGLLPAPYDFPHNIQDIKRKPTINRLINEEEYIRHQDEADEGLLPYPTSRNIHRPLLPHPEPHRQMTKAQHRPEKAYFGEEDQFRRPPKSILKNRQHNLIENATEEGLIPHPDDEGWLPLPKPYPRHLGLNDYTGSDA